MPKWPWKHVSGSELSQSGFRLWVIWRQALFIVLLLTVFGWGVWQWYADVYAFAWSEEEKTAYINQRMHLIELKEKEFVFMLDTITARAAAFHGDIQTRRPLFVRPPEEKK